MHEPLADLACQRRQLWEILLLHLQAADSCLGPGTDALTVQDVLRAYPMAAAAGRVPDRQELLRRHPELADALAAFFAEQGVP
jgi:hypothetical protein